MKLEIMHMTRYAYADPAVDSVNELRLTPRTDERQSCYQHDVTVEPHSSMMAYEDYFGNRVHVFSVNDAHRELVIRARSVVVTRELAPPQVSLSPQDELAQLRSEAFEDRFIEYLLPTQYTARSQELLEYAKQFPLNGQGVYPWIREVSSAIHRDLQYDPGATHVHTTVSDTLQLRRGVCQDYAHLMISVCRAAGVPARYVSGYHFVGDLQGGNADFEQASHAWVEVYIPGVGWYGIDPTNNAEIGGRYVKLGHGRDYKDIVPVKGIYRGTGHQRLEVTVDVRKTGE
jgi:transglutaminase-like putative cysteine protease